MVLRSVVSWSRVLLSVLIWVHSPRWRWRSGSVVAMNDCATAPGRLWVKGPLCRGHSGWQETIEFTPRHTFRRLCVYAFLAHDEPGITLRKQYRSNQNGRPLSSNGMCKMTRNNTVSRIRVSLPSQNNATGIQRKAATTSEDNCNFTKGNEGNEGNEGSSPNFLLFVSFVRFGS